MVRLGAPRIGCSSTSQPIASMRRISSSMWSTALIPCSDIAACAPRPTVDNWTKSAPLCATAGSVPVGSPITRCPCRSTQLVPARHANRRSRPPRQWSPETAHRQGGAAECEQGRRSQELLPRHHPSCLRFRDPTSIHHRGNHPRTVGTTVAHPMDRVEMSTVQKGGGVSGATPAQLDVRSDITEIDNLNLYSQPFYFSEQNLDGVFLVSWGLIVSTRSSCSVSRSMSQRDSVGELILFPLVL